MDISNKKRRSFLVMRQFISFCIIGFLGASLNYSVFFILFYFLSIYYIISSVIGYLIGIFIGFFLNKRFTFKLNNSTNSMALKYFLINFFSIFVGMLFLKFFVDSLNLNIYIANFFVIGITTILNFTGSKLIAFK